MMQIVYESDWSTHEEWAAVRIFEDVKGNLHVQYGGKSVFGNCESPPWDDPFDITWEDAMVIIDEWEN